MRFSFMPFIAFMVAASRYSEECEDEEGEVEIVAVLLLLVLRLRRSWELVATPLPLGCRVELEFRLGLFQGSALLGVAFFLAQLKVFLVNQYSSGYRILRA